MLKKNTEDITKGKIQAGFLRFKGKPFEIIVYILFLCNITLIIVNIGIWVMAAVQKLFITADFTSFYTGYYLVRIGQGAALYDASIQSAYQQLFMGGSISFAGGVLLFPNPPYVAILLSPLSILPINAAFYVWTAFQLGVLTWVLWLLNRIFSGWSRKERLVLGTATLAFWPLINNLLLGQFSLLLLAGILQLYIGIKDSKPLHSGLGFFLLALKPQALLIPGMMTLNKRSWLHALAGAMVGLLLLGLSVGVLGIQSWSRYLQSLQALGSYFGVYGVNPKTEYTIRGVLANALGNSQGSLINLISYILLALGIMLTWIIWSRNIALEERKFKLYFAIAITLSVFFSLHLNPHDALLLVFPAALFYDYLKMSNLPRKIYTVVILISPVIFFISAFSVVNLLGIFRPPTIIIIIILIWMIYHLVKEMRETQLHPQPLAKDS